MEANLLEPVQVPRTPDRPLTVAHLVSAAWFSYASTQYLAWRAASGGNLSELMRERNVFRQILRRCFFAFVQSRFSIAAADCWISDNYVSEADLMHD